jgi:coiled-coil domain-containing protein 130
MSSLAAARADNFYHPPDWDPSKGSRNKFHGSHGALGDRARKLHQGILIIRFEMPFNVWCGGCGHLIGKGVRFNAEKKQIGMYHSTKIWSFSMRTPCCQHRLEVHTDPRNAEYIVVTGGKRKVEAGDVKDDGDDGQVFLDPGRSSLRQSDPLQLLEAAEEDVRRNKEQRASLLALMKDSQGKYKDDAANNRELRRAMRSIRREETSLDGRRRELGLPDEIKMAPETAMDRLRAAAVNYGGGAKKYEKKWRHDRRQIRSSSIFSKQAVLAAKTGNADKRKERNSGEGRDAAYAKLKTRRIDPAVKLRFSDPK